MKARLCQGGALVANGRLTGLRRKAGARRLHSLYGGFRKAG
jgi:hypothetical protein